MATTKIVGIGLLSGGLDSTLALQVMKNQGVSVIGLNFSTGFCVIDHKRQMGNVEDPKKLRNEALRAGADVDVPVEIIDISREYLEMVTNPKHGYGSGMNPCIDCRIFMLQKAGQYMEETGAHFLFTGEVLGQRPMSQHRQALDLIERESGYQGLIVRPLSAKCLKPTIPEEKGWLDRNQLYGIRGRSRKDQMALAEEFEIHEYPQPAGGCCFLPDQNYSRKLKDLLEWKGKDNLRHEDIVILKVGRHLRLSESTKIVVGRNEQENRFLASLLNGRGYCTVNKVPGPFTLIEGEPSEQETLLIGAITARYSDGRDTDQVEIEMGQASGSPRSFTVKPATLDDIDKLRI